MDLLTLVDQLESLLSAGRQVPFSGRVLVDEREVLDLIDQMRVALPDEIRQARRISQERDRVIAQGKLEAERLIAEAQHKADSMLDERNLVQAAEVRSRGIIAEAERQADTVRAGADRYSKESLEGLRAELERILSTVNNGLQTLERQDTRTPLTP
jgi:cell division septum initiation protein DivIVA